jgi:copper transport protein
MRHADARPGLPTRGNEPGIYSRKAPALVMVGHWGITFTVAPKGAPAFTALVVDHATG